MFCAIARQPSFSGSYTLSKKRRYQSFFIPVFARREEQKSVLEARSKALSSVSAPSQPPAQSRPAVMISTTAASLSLLHGLSGSPERLTRSLVDLTRGSEAPSKSMPPQPRPAPPPPPPFTFPAIKSSQSRDWEMSRLGLRSRRVLDPIDVISTGLTPRLPAALRIV